MEDGRRRLQMDPANLRFTKQIIYDYFQGSGLKPLEESAGTVEHIIPMLRGTGGRLDCTPLPFCIRAVEYRGFLWSLDNRWLWVCRTTNVPQVEVEVVEPGESSSFSRLMREFQKSPTLFYIMSRGNYLPSLENPLDEKRSHPITRHSDPDGWNSDPDGWILMDLIPTVPTPLGIKERHAETVANITESTNPLLLEMEAPQEATAVKDEASMSAAERSLNAQLQEAEARAAAAQERERSSNDRISQTLSRMAAMEAQLSCFRAQHVQLLRSAERERQQALEKRQGYHAESSANHYCIGNKQLEEELNELKEKLNRSSTQEPANREILELSYLKSPQKALAEELVKLNARCEEYRLEAASLSALRGQFDSLCSRHTSALELLGELDEEVEGLRAEIADIKQMYREQIDTLLGQIERLSATM